MLPLPYPDGMEPPPITPFEQHTLTAISLFMLALLVWVMIDAALKNSELWAQIKRNARLTGGWLLSVLVLGQFLYHFLPNGAGLCLAIAFGMWLGRINASSIE